MQKIITSKDHLNIARMDAFVRSHCSGHFLQSPQWAEVKSKWDWRGIMIYRKGVLTGAMSLLIRHIPLVGSVLYAPRGPVCNREDPTVLTEFFEAVKKLARDHKAMIFYLDPDEPDTNQKLRRTLTSMGFQEKSHDGFGNLQPQYVFRLNIGSITENMLFQSFSQKTRYNIRLARRKGVTVTEYSGAEIIPEDALTHFAALMEATGQRDGFPVRDREYFRKLLQALNDDARLLLACYEGKPIAGTIEIIYGSKAWYLYGASGNAHRDTMPNYLLQWHMICYAMERGCSVYDFRGVPGELSKDNPLYGLYQFKKGFGGAYTKFSGLFSYTFRPIRCAVFQKLQSLRYFLAGKNQH